MNISNKDWFCYQCSLQFHSKAIYGVHLKLLHKVLVEEKSDKNKLTLDKSISSDQKSE